MRAVSRRSARATIALGQLLAAAVLLPSFKASSAAADPPSCFSGAHSLSNFGSRVYPEMGNGGYTSLHTDLRLNYDAIANLFLPGTHADLQVQSTQCLSDLSFDFEQTNGHTADGTGPNMTVSSVAVNGTPAAFTFVQPTYPGDPNGQNDPDPAAHAVSNVEPGERDEPEPARLLAAGQQHLAERHSRARRTSSSSRRRRRSPTGRPFTVTINYTGRPGVHTDGDGSTEGWFRIATAGSEGAFVTTEPVGNDSWMPMNNHPTAKPTYDIYDTTNIGKVADRPRRAGRLHGAVGTTYQPVPRAAVERAGRELPGRLGDVALALAGADRELPRRELDRRLRPDRRGRARLSGVQYWEAQASTITAAREGDQQDRDGQPGRHRQLPDRRSTGRGR